MGLVEDSGALCLVKQRMLGSVRMMRGMVSVRFRALRSQCWLVLHFWCLLVFALAITPSKHVPHTASSFRLGHNYGSSAWISCTVSSVFMQLLGPWPPALPPPTNALGRCLLEVILSSFWERLLSMPAFLFLLRLFRSLPECPCMSCVCSSTCLLSCWHASLGAEIPWSVSCCVLRAWLVIVQSSPCVGAKWSASSTSVSAAVELWDTICCPSKHTEGLCYGLVSDNLDFESTINHVRAGANSC